MHPILFRIGSLEIHTYGALVACGFMVGLMLAARRAKAEGISQQAISDIGLWLVVGGIVGGKLFHVLFYWRDFLDAWRTGGIASLRQGFVFFGGFIVAVTAAILYARRKQIPLLKLGDAFAAPIALGHFFGRLGCYFEGCCYGKACDLPWGVHFPDTHPTRGMLVHPTELYEAIANLVLFAGLTLYYRHKKFDGQIWWLYLIGYSILRFSIEFTRGDYPTHYFNVFTSAQLIAIVLAGIGIVGLLKTPKNSRQPDSTTRTES
jgi:phosphatidylglycerol:prolipoprotein diacylglycerol transferase